MISLPSLSSNFKIKSLSCRCGLMTSATLCMLRSKSENRMNYDVPVLVSWTCFGYTPDLGSCMKVTQIRSANKYFCVYTFESLLKLVNVNINERALKRAVQYPTSMLRCLWYRFFFFWSLHAIHLTSHHFQVSTICFAYYNEWHMVTVPHSQCRVIQNIN